MIANLTSPLQQLNPDYIKQNTDNPRLVFREAEMLDLMNSIKEVGIKVPLAVYQEGAHFVLIDGERRWRCSKRLNLKEIPALVQPKPAPLENLLMMFNIHNVRLDWDLMPMAIKLGEIRKMLAKQGKKNDVKSLAGLTGLRVSGVERALELLDLPMEYQRLLLEEAAKPRNEQKIKPDLFIEIYKSLNAIKRHVPEVLDEVKPKAYVKAMVEKYRAGTIGNVVAFREVSKIARSEKAGVDSSYAIPSLVKLAKNKSYKISDAYSDTVELAYRRRDLRSRVISLTEMLKEFNGKRQLGDDLVEPLEYLRDSIIHLVGR